MSLINVNSKRLLKPLYTYTQENIQYIPYKNYSLKLILLFLQNLNMMEPGLINIIKECLFLNLNKHKIPFIYLEHINLFYFGSQLSLEEEFNIFYNIQKENRFCLKKIFIYNKFSTYEKQSYQFLIKHISILKEKLLIYYCNKDFKILNLNGLINSIKQQKILELSKFEFINNINNIKNIQHNEDIQEDLIKNEKQIEQYNILMKIFNEQIEICISKIDSIKLKYELKLDKNSIF